MTKKRKKILDYIKKFENKFGYFPTVREIARHFGLSSPATIHEHLQNLKKEGQLSNQNNIEETYLEGEIQNLPVLGLIAAGAPIEAIENPTENIKVSTEITKKKNCYVLKVKGDSMVESLIADGDYVVVEKKDYANDGDTVVALLEDGTATLKDYYKEKHYIRLQPRNAKYSPIRVKNLIIQGKVVGIIRKV